MNNVIKSVFCYFVLLLAATGFGFAQQVNTPAPSPFHTFTQTVGLTEISMEYSRPGVKGREIFGKTDQYLLPYDSMWRTGANASTKISFSDSVEINGQKVPDGTYAIYTIPGADEWTVMLYKDLTLGGNTDAYNEEDEQARFTVKPQELPFKMETLTFVVNNIRNESATLDLMWENTLVSLPFNVPTDKKVMAQINNLMDNPNMIVANLYNQSANYYLNTDRDMEQALEWINKAIEINPTMFTYNTKASILAKMENYKAAIEANNEAHKIGQEATGGLKTFYENTFKRTLNNQIAEWEQKGSK